MRLLLAEDTPRLRRSLTVCLTKAGHVVDAAADGAEAWALLTGHSYDMLVLDIMLPEIDGLTILTRLRARGDSTPVLLLTARDAVEDRVRGLMSGADDYLVKPFSLAELEARIITLHRRRHGVFQSRFHAGPLEIDTAARRTWRDGSEIPLTAREFALLELLALSPGRVFTREQIENVIYPDSSPPVSNAVDSAVCILRRKLSPAGGPPLIHTRRGLGYCFEAA
jgi:DNA-binding response OmpR family regulator